MIYGTPRTPDTSAGHATALRSATARLALSSPAGVCRARAGVARGLGVAPLDAAQEGDQLVARVVALRVDLVRLAAERPRVVRHLQRLARRDQCRLGVGRPGRPRARPGGLLEEQALLG